MELSKPGQTTAFQTSMTPSQVPSSDNQFPIFTPTNWTLLQNRPNLPNPNTLPIRPFAGSRILMPWEHVTVPPPNQRPDKMLNAQITPPSNKRLAQIEPSPKSSATKGFSRQNSNKRPIQQIESSQKTQSNAAIESVRSKLRESLAGALSVSTGEKSNEDAQDRTGVDKETNDSKLENIVNINPDQEATILVDELLQGNGLSWAADLTLLSQNTPDKKRQFSLQDAKDLASQIEAELFHLFGGVNKKYKEKGRSLLFNLKDQSNPELRERVLNGEITPEKLCNMSAEELASKELSEWRQAKAQEMAEAIVLVEDSGMDARKRVKKTHKGEFEVMEEEQDTTFSLEAEIKAGAGVSTRVEPVKDSGSGKVDGDEGSDLMLELMGEGFRDVDHLSPVVTLDEFMKDLDSEPPFVDIAIVKPDEVALMSANDDKIEKKEKSDDVDEDGEKEKNAVVSDDDGVKESKDEGGEESKVKSAPVGDKLEVSSEIDVEELKEDAIWEGVVQLNVSALASVVALYKSGEKPSMKEWPGFIEIKGRVRLDPFEKFLKDLPLSRSRAIMLAQIKWKEGSMESGRQNLSETIESYITDARVGLAEPGPGVELYLCPSNEKMLELFKKLLPKDLSENLLPSKNTLIGVIVWRRPLVATISPRTPSQQHNNSKLQSNINNNSRKEQIHKSTPRSSVRKQPPVRTDKSDGHDDEDDVPPGFGHMVNKVNNNNNNKDDDDLPEFDFRTASKNVSCVVKPVQQMRDLIQKYGHGGSSSSNNNNGSSKKSKSWDDDDDIPEWNPNQDHVKIQNLQSLQSVQVQHAVHSNNQFIPPTQQNLQSLQPPLVQTNFRAPLIMQPNNYPVNNSNNNNNNNNNNNQWWNQQQQQSQYGYRMPNNGTQTWRPDFQGNNNNRNA